ncbi:MAG: SPOR domain-containing protein [Pseudomonadota bacterium]
MKNPNTSPQSAEGQGLDPLEELARIMNDTNNPNPNKRPEGAAAPQDDPLDLGLGDQGLAELFGDQRFDEDPVLATSFEAELDSAANEPADALFKDLDFGEIELPGLDDSTPAVAPAPPPMPETAMPEAAAPPPVPTQMAAPVADDPVMPSLTDHLTPRPTPNPEPEQNAYGAVQDDDLLAAMDALALDEPAQASMPAPSAPPLPFEQPDVAPPAFAAAHADPSDFGQSNRADDFGFDAEPDQQSEFGAFEEPDAGEGRSGPGKVVLFALAAVALLGVGGVVAFGLISGNNAEGTAPQVIAAAEGDDKVEPVDAEDTQARPGDAVFSRLDEGEAPADGAPRVILSQPANDGLPLRSGERLPSADIAPAAPGSTASRAVRTVTVRADGTVVESTTPSPDATQDVQGEAADARPVEVVSVSPTGVSVNTQPIAEAVSAAQTAAQSVEATTQEALRNAAQATLSEATQAVASTAPPVPVARPAIVPVQTQPVQVAPAQTLAQSAAPVQLATPATAPTQAATPQPVVPQPTATQPVTTAPATTQPITPASVPAGDFVVQLASLRSEDEARATFGRLQNRFGSILSGFGPNIQRADLGDRGIYHRVRVGPMDRAAADSLCQRYQSAGGDCFVQRQ